MGILFLKDFGIFCVMIGVTYLSFHLDFIRRCMTQNISRPRIASHPKMVTVVTMLALSLSTQFALAQAPKWENPE